MATPAIDSRARLEEGGSGDLDDVMQVMEAAFGNTYGEAWTRSQCAGILPMAGVALIIARDGDSGQGGSGETATRTSMPWSRACCSVIPTEPTSGSVNVTRGTAR